MFKIKKMGVALKELLARKQVVNLRNDIYE